jgi:hypothetical protein
MIRIKVHTRFIPYTYTKNQKLSIMMVSLFQMPLRLPVRRRRPGPDANFVGGGRVTGPAARARGRRRASRWSTSPSQAASGVPGAESAAAAAAAEFTAGVRVSDRPMMVTRRRTRPGPPRPRGHRVRDGPGDAGIVTVTQAHWQKSSLKYY